MSGSTPYDVARAAYKKLLLEYGRALAARDSRAKELFEQSCLAWDRVRASAPTDAPEANVETEMHLVLAFSYAVGARDVAEAERIYRAMSDEGRRNVDAADDSGSMKIWLRR